MSAMNRAARYEAEVEEAFALVFNAAKTYPDFTHDKLAEMVQRDPEGIKALLKAAGMETLGDVSAPVQSGGQARFPLVIGQPCTDQGIPFSQLTSGSNTINLNLIADFLRDASGKIVELTGNQAVAAIKALNGGVQHGNGYAKATNRAVARREFKDGTLKLASQSDLLKLASELGTNPALKQMNEIIASGSNYESYVVSDTEVSAYSSILHRFRLKDGYDGLDNKDLNRSRVVVLRGFNCG